MLSSMPSLSKSHDQVSIDPVDRSVKVTVRGASPLVMSALKSAVIEDDTASTLST